MRKTTNWFRVFHWSNPKYVTAAVSVFSKQWNGVEFSSKEHNCPVQASRHSLSQGRWASYQNSRLAANKCKQLRRHSPGVNHHKYVGLTTFRKSREITRVAALLPDLFYSSYDHRCMGSNLLEADLKEVSLFFRATSFPNKLTFLTLKKVGPAILAGLEEGIARGWLHNITFSIEFWDTQCNSLEAIFT